MRKRVLTASALFCATLAASACSGDGTGPGDGGGQLTRAEAEALNRAILAIGAGTARTGASGASQQARASAAAAGSGSFSFNFNTTHPCVPGGSAAVAGNLSGSYDQAAQTAQLQSAMSVAHNACAVHTEQGVVRISGDPDIDLGLTASANATGLTALRITEVGAFTWDRGNGNSGRCTVDVTAELIAGTQNVRLNGTFCGISVDGTVSGTS